MATISVILIAVLSLISLCFALPAGRTCGTEHPSYPESGTDKAIPACGRHECDDPAIRDQYLLNGASPTITINMNVIYFGVLAGSNKTRYDAQLAFFKSEYAKHMNISWNINTQVITEQYQVVNASNRVLHKKIAAEYYVEGSMTLLLSIFNPNKENLLGYAYLPQTIDFETDPAQYYAILDLKYAITPQGTTMLHEVGHMLGLFHTFTSQCDSCSENINSPNLNTVGDFCSDTKPVWLTFYCDQLNIRDHDCNNVKYTTNLAQLPQDNYMAYTEDSCQDQFTPQQAARARCYLDRLLTFVTTAATPGTNIGAPTSGGKVPMKSPVKAPSSVKVSMASRAEIVVMLVGLVFLVVSV